MAPSNPKKEATKFAKKTIKDLRSFTSDAAVSNKTQPATGKFFVGGFRPVKDLRSFTPDAVVSKKTQPATGKVTKSYLPKRSPASVPKSVNSRSKFPPAWTKTTKKTQPATGKVTKSYLPKRSPASVAKPVNSRSRFPPAWTKTTKKAPVVRQKADATVTRRTENYLEKMPWDILAIIFKMAFGDGPSVVYTTCKISAESPLEKLAKARRPARPDPLANQSRIELSGFTGVDYSPWKWAHELTKTFPSLQGVAESQLGSKSDSRIYPLSSVLPATDLVVYYFQPVDKASGKIVDYDWAGNIDKSYSHDNLGPGIWNVGIPWDEPLAKQGFKCHCWADMRTDRSGHRRFRDNRGLPMADSPGDEHGCYRGDMLCPLEVAAFVDHFDSVRNVFFMIKLKSKHMRDNRLGTVEKIKKTVRDFAEKARKDPELHTFEDTGRLWVEVDPKEGRSLITGYNIFDAVRESEGHFRRLRKATMSRSRRADVRFRVMVSSYRKDLGV